MRQVLDECREHERIFQDLTRQEAIMVQQPERTWRATKMSRLGSTSCSAAVSSMLHCLPAICTALSLVRLVDKAAMRVRSCLPWPSYRS